MEFPSNAPIRVKGLRKVTRALRNKIKKIEGEISRVGMKRAGKFVMKKSKQLTPVDTGNLRESAFVIFGGDGKNSGIIATNDFDTTKPEGLGVAAEHESIIFEETIEKAKTPFAKIGHTAFYALKEHEAVGEQHKIGVAKFLEKAFFGSQKDILKILKGSVKR